jgi:hypothetical protein
MCPLLGKMASVLPVWAALIDQWDLITRLHPDEACLGWSQGTVSTPQAYGFREAVKPISPRRVVSQRLALCQAGGLMSCEESCHLFDMNRKSAMQRKPSFILT